MRLAKCGNTTELSIDVHTLRADPHQTTDLTRTSSSIHVLIIRLIIFINFAQHIYCRFVYVC